MRKLWECQDWTQYIPKDCRTRLRLRFDKGVDEEVKRACKEFVNWLREYYEFPMRVPIYFKATKTIRTRSGEEASASFFRPYDKEQEPYIRIAVDDYYDMLERSGKDNALGGILGSIAHELSHYFQWIKDLEFSERQALYYRREILYDYAETREHP